MGDLVPHEVEFDLALRWHGVLLVSESPLGRLAPELCGRVLRHLQLEKLIEQRFDIPHTLVESISSMKENMVDTNVEVDSSLATCGAVATVRHSS